MSTEGGPSIPPYSDVPRADPAMVTTEMISLDDPRAPSVHCTNIAVAGDTKYATWFGGSYEGSPDVRIWFSKNSDGTWTYPKVIAGDGNTVHWNPVLFIPDHSKLYVFFKTGPKIPAWITYWIQSEDGGDTWSEPKELVPGDRSGGRGPQKNPPIVLSNGDWLAGASYEVTNPKGSDAYGIWDAFSDLAPKPGPDDTFKQGDVWIKSELIKLPDDRGTPNGSFPGEGIIQPGLWESKTTPGLVHMTMRSSVGCIVQADSSDFGRTWTPGYRTVLPNNNSGHDMTILRDGRVVWAGNYVTKSWGPRTPLCLMISDDDGKTWRLWATIEDDAPPNTFDKVVALETGIVNDGHSEFSYPCLAPIENGLYVSYTWQRRGVKLAKVVAQ